MGKASTFSLRSSKAATRSSRRSARGSIPGGRHSSSALSSCRDGDTLLVTKIDRLARSTSDLYRIVSELAEKGVSFKVLDDPSIDTTSRTGKLVMGILALIAEFENDIRRERQMDGIAKAKDRGVKFGRKRELTDEKVKEIRTLRESGETVPAIIKRTGFSKASVYRALGNGALATERLTVSTRSSGARHETSIGNSGRRIADNRDGVHGRCLRYFRRHVGELL